LAEFSNTLLEWYAKHKRELPWREAKDPYLIWLSEIILQQTRVEQGLPYFERFKVAFPTINDLADANEEYVLKLWQGLGYYSRARNLHHSAKVIQEQHNGVFPSNYEAIRSLKGVGDYTAAAVASIAFDEAVPVIDGNVFRFISRFYGIETDIQKAATKKEIRKILDAEIDNSDPGSFNQAMMDFGSTVCSPKNPSCDDCPFRSACYARLNRKIEMLPFKSKNSKARKRFFNYILLTNVTKLAIRKRAENDIWKGLYEFPMIEKASLLDPEEMLVETNLDESLNPRLIKVYDLNKHILSHQHIYSRFFHIEVDHLPSSYQQISSDQLHQYPVSRMIEKFLEAGPKYLSKK